MRFTPVATVLLVIVGFIAVALTAFSAGRSSHGDSIKQHLRVWMPASRFGPAAGSSSTGIDHAGIPKSRSFYQHSSSSSSARSATDRKYFNVSQHPACAFFRSGAKNVLNERRWGPYGQCNMNEPHDWLKRARSNCYSCTTGANVCSEPPVMLYHQYLEYLHPTMWEGNLLSIKAFLMTQNLANAHMIIWAPQVDKVVVANKSKELFEEFSDYISVRRFDYDDVIKGTPFLGDPYFGNGTLVKQMMPDAGSYSDIVRMLILNKYGGFWMDNDVVLYQDLTHLLSTSYQFVMRWMNLHIMRMEKGSRLMQRALQLATTMPLNHPDFNNTIIDQLCKPNGYYQIVPSRYGYTDIYNGCLFRLLLRFNNTGPPDAVLYDMPLGWFDSDWKGCFNSRLSLNDTKWREVATHYLAMHNRYPANPYLAESGEKKPEDTPLSRVLRTVSGFWKACGRKDCTPVDGMTIMAYDAFQNKYRSTVQ